MGSAIAARHKGDDYQARWFWVQACRMFDERSKVVAVEYEAKKPDAFDDVAVYYNDDMRDEDRFPLHAEYYQLKFHVRGDGCVTHEALTKPEFINATKFSILERLKAAQELAAPGDGRGALFYFYSVWPVDPHDPLHRVISNTDGRIDWNVLAEGKTKKSATFNMRKLWREHLRLGSDEELRVVLQPLRIVTGYSLKVLGFTLNDKLTIAGFLPVEEGVQIHPYDELTRKLLEIGQTRFTAQELEKVIKEHHLFRGRFVAEPDVHRLGIRSFMRYTENLADQTDALLSLLPCFNGRYIKAPELWQTEVYPQVRDFLSQELRSKTACHLHLHTHTSIAFAAGYCLDPKSGVEASPVQPTRAGREVWTPESCEPDTYPGLVVLDTDFERRDGTDVAVALAITHDIRKDVEAYVSETLPTVGRIIPFSLPGGHGGAVVHNGSHAKLLAEQLSQQLKAGRTGGERKGVVHLFVAAPNGLMFFVGQLARSFGRCVLYEYDFESNELGAYTPSLSFPPAT